MDGWKKAGLVCCSDGEPKAMAIRHHELEELLNRHGITAECSLFLYAEQGGAAGTGIERAEAVNRFFRDPSVDALFDLSGGDMANEVLEHLDFESIRSSHARFWGYSDLTTVINGIYAKTGKTSVLYQVKNLVGSCGVEQEKVFFSPAQKELFTLPIRFLRGSRLEGTVVGGNIRCLLKLSGTEYFPDLTDKILLLEANSGRVPQLTTYLSQLSQLGAFRKIRGLVLGTFSQMEREQLQPSAEELVLRRVGEHLPVVKTDFVGHGPDSRAVLIGGQYCFTGTFGQPIE